MSGIGSPPAAVLIAVLRGYQRWISPALPPRCRFYPSCSSYAVQALTLHGPLRGSWLTLRRVLRCQPFNAGGVDPVPDAAEHRRAAGPPASTASRGAPLC